MYLRHLDRRLDEQEEGMDIWLSSSALESGAKTGDGEGGGGSG
jgi:hypothetical protein